MFGPIKKLVLETRRVDDEHIIIIITYNFGDDMKDPGVLVFKLLGLMPVPDDPKSRAQIREFIEKIYGIENHGCQLI
jgi:hypothetical protein